MNQQDSAPAEAARAADILRTPASDAASSDVATPRSYAVHFGQKLGYAMAPADTFRFIGDGLIRIDHANVVISGKRKRPFWFGAEQTHAFAHDRVRNVLRAGKTIRFDLAGAAGRQFVQCVADNEAMAEAIVAHLPNAVTPEFAREQAERSDFHARLDKLSPRAPVTPTLVAMNVVVFVAMCVAGVGVFQPDGDAVIRWGSNFGPLTMGGQWWRLFTAMFLHFGIVHLALNMWALFQSGRMVERMYGSARFLALYLFAGLTGSMASLLWNPQVNSAGASGAIFGIFGGLLAFVVNPRNAVPASIMKEQRNSTVLFAAYSLFYGFAHAGIDNAAHIGGLVGGFAMGFLLARPLDAAARSRFDFRHGLLSVAAGLVVSGLLLWPLVQPSAKVRNGQDFQRALMALGPQEQEAIDASNAMLDRAKTGGVPPSELAMQVQGDVLPKWDVPYRGISAVTLDPGDSQYPLQQALLRYLGARRKSVQLFAEAVTRDDAALMAQAQAAKTEAETALAEIAAINKAGH